VDQPAKDVGSSNVFRVGIREWDAESPVVIIII
jgi:hypothetical protein